ncbi:MAG: hypothetical protein M4579_000313 [Chaenotheca gracillima]|nr:MAG: hypothetical protein M4579_000313 [Chaenotheca gracillima]
MATGSSAGSVRTLDPSKPGRYPVAVGNSVSKGQTKAPVYTGVRYNHKPSQTASKRTTKIKHSTSNSSGYVLSMTDDDDKSSTYRYAGSRSDKRSSGSYFLVFDPAKQGFALERVDSSFNFNLASAPWETSPAKLSQQYPQLDLGATDADPDDADMFLGSEEEAEPDASNPYDFRHWMKDAHISSPEGKENQPRKIRGSTPRTTTSMFKPSPSPQSGSRNQPSVTKPKSTLKQSAKPRDSGFKSPDRDDADDESSKDDSSDDGGLIIEMEPETKRLKRRASTKRQGLGVRGAKDRPLPPPDSDEDENHSDDGLTIEMEPDTRPRRGLAAAMPGRLTPGRPISLRSASSVSPASHAVSPVRGVAHHSSSESDVDEEEDRWGAQRDRQQAYDRRSADSDVDDDLKLPSPMGQPEDTEGDLAAELAQALGSEAALARHEVSESESEEE